MKKLIYNVLAVVSISFGVVSCVKEVEPYTPAEKPSGDQVFFHKDLKTSFEATDSTLFWNEEAQAWSNTIKLAFQRVVSDQARTVAIKCDPDTTITKDVFTCPETVDFAAGESVAYAEIGFDRDKLLANLAKDFTVTVTITEKDHVSPYGKTSVTLSIVYPDPKPWIVFDKGTLTEVAWGEKEVKKEMKYQQITDNLRLCKIEGCWGHNTIEKGEPYDVQPYTWIWDTETNKCVVRAQYIGADTGGDGIVYASDAAGFYDLYKSWGQASLSDAEYYAWASAWLVKNEFFVPYYDGNGGFFLADWYFLVAGGAATGSGYQFGGDPDSFIGDNFTRTTDYNKDLEYKPFADGIDKSSLWKEEFPIQVQVAEDPNSVEETPSQVWYIPGYVNDTTGIAFIVVASDADPAKAKWSITDAANTQYTDHNVFGKKLGYNVIGRKSSITGVPGEYPCEIELCINANLYDVEYDEKGKPVYTLAYALGEFVDKITLTNATEVWYNADQLNSLKKEYYVDNYVLYAKDFFNGGDVSWNVSVEDAGVIEETSYLKFKSLVPYPSSYLPQNEFLVEWYNGYLYFAADTMLGKFQYGDQELGVTLYPFGSETEEYFDDAYLLGGYYVNDEKTYDCVPFVDYPLNESPVDGFYAEVEGIGGLCAFYQICMEFAAPAATSSAKKSFVPAKYEVHTLSEVKALRSASVARANFRIPMAVSQAERHAEKVKVNRHSGSIDTSNARKVEKNLTPVQVQLKNNIRF